ncbi:MAG: RNA 2',3'-cyclic phosphodiesterase [Bacteroidia bacterium]
MSLRLFTGFAPDASLIEEVARWRPSVTVQENIRWKEPDLLHLTAYFFGKWEPEALENLRACLSIEARKHRPFSLQFKDVCLAPSGQHPRMIWVRFHQKTAFAKLTQGLHTMFSQFDPDHQFRSKPTPHITLARLKDWPAEVNLPYMEASSGLKLLCRDLVLWQSEVVDGRTIYTELGRWKLGR